MDPQASPNPFPNLCPIVINALKIAVVLPADTKPNATGCKLGEPVNNIPTPVVTNAVSTASCRSPHTLALFGARVIQAATLAPA